MAPLHIAVVGYGSASLILLKTLQDLPPELRERWRVTVFERREALGGQWLLDESNSDVPLSGLYQTLRTNTPVHMMTYPHTPFEAHTDLFPHWTVVLRYLQQYAERWGLYSSSEEQWHSPQCPRRTTKGHISRGQLRPQNTPPEVAQRELPRRILLNRELHKAEWKRDASGRGKWRTVSKAFPRQASGASFEEDFDAIIDATGHLVHPSVPHWHGEDEWLDARASRKIMHSAFYRGPDAFAGQTVLIVGAGPSALDGSLQIGRTAQKVYHSVSSSVVLPPSWPFERKCRLSHFDANGAVFEDGSRLDDIETVYLGTGFVIRYEYLERGGVIERRPGQTLPPFESEQHERITSTDRYLRPLYEHTISFANIHGPSSLFFCGNIMSTSYRFSNAIQAALIAWTLALPEILPNRAEMSRTVIEDEARTGALGRKIEMVGHRQGAPHLGESEVYQRRIVAFLRSNGIEIGCGREKTGVVMEPWREEVRKDFWMCMRGWSRLEKQNRTAPLLQLARDEDGFAAVSRQVIAEQRRYELDTGRDPAESEISGWS